MVTCGKSLSCSQANRDLSCWKRWSVRAAITDKQLENLNGVPDTDLLQARKKCDPKCLNHLVLSSGYQLLLQADWPEMRLLVWQSGEIFLALLDSYLSTRTFCHHAKQIQSPFNVKSLLNTLCINLTFLNTLMWMTSRCTACLMTWNPINLSDFTENLSHNYPLFIFKKTCLSSNLTI